MIAEGKQKNNRWSLKVVTMPVLFAMIPMLVHMSEVRITDMLHGIF